MPQEGREEFNLIEQTDPPVPLNAKYMWVFSARHTIEKTHENCPGQPINYKASSTDNASTVLCDKEDDYSRMYSALEWAQKIVQKKTRKEISALTKEDYEKYGPWIIYNGSDTQNAALERVIHGDMKALLLPYYPASKFIILALPPDQIHTGGQLNSLATHKKTDRRLLGLNKKNVEVALFSSAYHVPRLRRLFSSQKFTNPFAKDTRITIIGVDRRFKSPCAHQDIQGELERIEIYTRKGDIGEPVGCDWYHAPSLKNWTPLRAARKRPELIEFSREIKALDLSGLGRYRLT